MNDPGRNEPRLALRGVGFRYGALQALDGVDLAIAAGERLAIIGPNGSGKSTLLRLLSGTLRPGPGSVSLDGVSLATLRASERARRIAFVPQETHVIFDFSALEIVLMGRAPRLGAMGVETRADLQIATRCLAFTDASHLASRPLSHLSSGERQRVLLARALAQEPDVILLDEPTAFLDLGHQVQFLELLAALQAERGMTVVFVSHDINLAARYADRMVLLASGKIAAEGPPRAVLTANTLRAAYGVEVLVVESGAVRDPIVLVTGLASSNPLRHMPAPHEHGESS